MNIETYLSSSVIIFFMVSFTYFVLPQIIKFLNDGLPEDKKVKVPFIPHID